MSPTPTRDAAKPVVVVNLIPATGDQGQPSRPRSASPGMPSSTWSETFFATAAPPRYPPWVKPVLMWTMGLVLACAWDRAVWLWTSNGGAPALEYWESGSLWFLAGIPKSLGRMEPWLVLAVGLIGMDWVRSDTHRLMHALRRATFLVMSAAAAGLLAEALKLLIRRGRPEVADGWYSFRSFADEALSAKNLGMASSHAAVAFGAALALGAIWPRWRWAFLAGALACALSRVLMGAHFLSDVYVGASLGFAGFALIRAADARNNPGRPLASGAAWGGDPRPALS